MPASEEFFEELREELVRADTEEEHNELLDEWYDAEYRATDYDAVQWGFEPSSWMSAERKQMEARSRKPLRRPPRVSKE